MKDPIFKMLKEEISQIMSEIYGGYRSGNNLLTYLLHNTVQLEIAKRGYLEIENKNNNKK